MSGADKGTVTHVGLVWSADSTCDGAIVALARSGPPRVARMTAVTLIVGLPALARPTDTPVIPQLVALND